MVRLGPPRGRRRQAAEWAGRQRLPAAALADVGNIYGWGKWKRVAPAGGFKPLFGCELEVGTNDERIVQVRPVRDAPDPRAAAEAIQATIASVFPA